jgi:hypothetical protein
MNIAKRFSFALPLVIAGLLASCAGYNLGPAKPAKLAGVTKIHVPTFKNDTLEPRVAVWATNAVIKELQTDGTYEITDRDNADAVLNGTIEGVDNLFFRQAKGETFAASELLSVITLSYALVDKGTGAPIAGGMARGDSNYVLDPNIKLSERQAFNEVFRRIGIDVSSDLSEGW